jgi:uncharacterized membrane protein
MTAPAAAQATVPAAAPLVAVPAAAAAVRTPAAAAPTNTVTAFVPAVIPAMAATGTTRPRLEEDPEEEKDFDLDDDMLSKMLFEGPNALMP